VSTWPIVAYSAFLLYVMVFELGTLCLFCLTMDLVNVLVLVVIAWSAGATPGALSWELRRLSGAELRRALAPAFGILAVTLAASLLGHDALRRSLEADARAAVAAASSESPATAVHGRADRDEKNEASGSRKLPTKRWQVQVDAEDPALGPADAKIVVVMFGDFQCGYCKKLEHAARAVRKVFSDDLRFVFKHFPMSPRCNAGVHNEIHRFACEAAQSAECARRQGKFWRMHELLYKNQHRLERRDLDHYASEADLDPSLFASCMADSSSLDAVRKDAEEGARLNLNGTPRTFVNGRLFFGPLSEDLLTFVIRGELGEVTGEAAETYAPPPVSASSLNSIAPASAPIHVAYGGLDCLMDPFEASLDSHGCRGLGSGLDALGGFV
jgi:protein-disulfide isomerase